MTAFTFKGPSVIDWDKQVQFLTKLTTLGESNVLCWAGLEAKANMFDIHNKHMA